jgi:hypothetical protein
LGVLVLAHLDVAARSVVQSLIGLLHIFLYFVVKEKSHSSALCGTNRTKNDDKKTDAVLVENGLDLIGLLASAKSSCVVCNQLRRLGLLVLNEGSVAINAARVLCSEVLPFSRRKKKPVMRN